MKLIIPSLLLLLLSCAQIENKYENDDLVSYVNPLIGTAKSTTISGTKHSEGTEQNSQVQPSVTVPFGMTNWSPQTQNTEEKCFSSYYYKDSIITGFRGSHWLSGSCTQDYGSFTIMPISGELISRYSKRGSLYKHENEISTPYYYKVFLDNYNIIAEMTATTRSAIFQFTFEDAGDAHIVINPNSDEGKGFVKIIPDRNEIVGYNPVHRIYQGWGKAAGFSGYFVMRIEKQFHSYGVYAGKKNHPERKQIQAQDNVGGYFSINVDKGEKVNIKVGSSFVSIDEARKNLDAEIPQNDFENVKNNLKETWNNLLNKINVKGGSKEDKTKFYTAMYHSFQQPRIYNDVSGTYPRFDGNSEIDTIVGGNYYGDFSVWDTYRALHSLYNIIVPDQQRDMVNSLLIKAKVGGWLPIFPCWNSYTSAMIGDHVTSIIAESFVKGIINITEDDYKLLKQNADKTPENISDYKDGKGRRALESYLKYGYIPLEDSVNDAFHHNEQVSRTLEYAYDDFALSQIAKKLGKTDDYKYYLQRSKNYKNVFDSTVNSMNGRYKDGSFTKEFNRTERLSFITEGSPWQYTWYVPHDVEGLIDLMGGEENFNADLDEFFKTGQYWHGNEPGHQTPFLYTYSGQAWKTQKIVADIMDEEYGIGPGGLSGNDDAGQMSAWYVFSALGFYPVSPVLPEYRISGPRFNEIRLKISDNKELLIIAKNYSKENIYIKSIFLNGKKIPHNLIGHDDIINGGKIEFEMSNEPNQ